MTDRASIIVTYTSENDWFLAETSLYSGDCDLIPIGLDGTPDLSAYPFKTTHGDLRGTFTYEIPISLIPAGYLWLYFGPLYISSSGRFGTVH